MIHGRLCNIIIDMDAIFENLKTLGKDMEATIPRVPVDEYYKAILAAERLRESIEFLREITGRQEAFHE